MQHRPKTNNKQKTSKQVAGQIWPMGHTWPNPSLECSSPSVHPDDAVPCQWCEFYDLHSHGVERSPAAGHAQGQWLRFALLASPL